MPTIHPCSQSGKRLWVARKALHLHEPEIHSQHGSGAWHVPTASQPRVSTVCRWSVQTFLMWATRSESVISPVPCRRKHRGSASRSSAQTRWLATTRTWQRGAGGAEQSQFQPSVRSVMVALGVFAGLIASVGTRRHQRSLFWGLHLWVWQRFRVEVNGKRQRGLSCLRERAGLSWRKARLPVSCVDKINGYSCSWSPGYEERLSAEYVGLQQEELRRTSWHRQCWSRALEVQRVATKKKSTQLRRLMDAELRTRGCPKASQSRSGWSSTTLTSLNSEAGDAVNDLSKVFEAILQPGDEILEKVNPIQLDMDMDGVTSTNQTSTKSSEKVTAQHLRRFVLRRLPSPRRSTAKKWRLMLLNSSKQRSPWQRRPLSMQLSKRRTSKHVAVERSLKMHTSVTTITVESETAQGCHRESNGDQGNGGEVCVECGRDCPDAWDSAWGDRWQHVQHIEQQSSGSKKSTDELISDRDSVSTELQAVVEWLAKLNDMCVAKAIKSEEKSQKCAAEFSGNELEEALSILSVNALLQRPRPCIEPQSMKPWARILRRRRTSSSTKLPRLRSPAQTVYPLPVRLRHRNGLWPRAEARAVWGEAFITTGRAPAVLSHPSLVCRAPETTARCACTTHLACRGVSIRVVPKSRRQRRCRLRCDQDVCKEGARCSVRENQTLLCERDNLMQCWCSCVNRARGNHSTCGWRDSVHWFDRARGLRLMSEACAKLEQVRGTLPWRWWCGVRGCNAVEERCSSGVQRGPGTQQRRLVHDPSLQPRYRMRQQHIPEEDQAGHAQRTRSKMKYMQQYVKEQGDTPLCNMNRAEKGTVTLDEDHGEVPTVGKTETQRKNPIIQSTRATQHCWTMSVELV